MSAVKLSKTQQELLDAMRGGVRVIFISGLNAHYFRTDQKSLRYATADALVNSGAVEIYDVNFNGHELRIKEPAK